MKEEIFLAALCAIGKTLPVCLKHSLEGKSWCHHSADALSLIPFHNTTRWMYTGNILVSWKYIMFSRERKTDLFFLWNWNNLLMQVTWKALSTTSWYYRPWKQARLSRMSWMGLVTPCLKDLRQSLLEPREVHGLWRQRSCACYTETTELKRPLLQVMLIGERECRLTVNRNCSTFVNQTGATLKSVLCIWLRSVLCGSWRLLSEQGCALSGDRQFFRAHMAAASKCMYHCGWINKYPLKEPGSEE